MLNQQEAQILTNASSLVVPETDFQCMTVLVTLCTTVNILGSCVADPMFITFASVLGERSELS